jgi:pimeloyl-ACP methyl ester carboxylesterase
MHGLPTAKEIFAPVLPHLDSRCRVITFDLHDYGESERLRGPMLHTERAAALDELRAHLGLERFCLVAHDLGTSVAVDYMGAFGEHVEKLVLMSPPVYPDFEKPAVVDLVRSRGLGPLLLWGMKDPLMRTSIRRGMHHPERFTPEIQRAIMGAFDGAEGRAALLRKLRWGTPETTFARYPEIIRAIRVPTLVLQGVHAPYILREHAERLTRDIPGARLVLIEDGSHFLPLIRPCGSPRSSTASSVCRKHRRASRRMVRVHGSASHTPLLATRLTKLTLSRLTLHVIRVRPKVGGNEKVRTAGFLVAWVVGERGSAERSGGLHRLR